MARSYTNVIVVNPTSGVPLSGVTVTINLRSTSTLAVLYSTQTGTTTLGNPLVTGVGGTIPAWVNEGSYDLVISGSGFVTFTQPFESVSGNSIISLTNANFNSANVDGSTSTPSLRTLGTGANQAMPGNTVIGSNPTGSAGGSLSGTYPNPGLNLSITNTWAAEQAAPDFKITGLSGTSRSFRLVGGTSGGPPSGTFEDLDVSIDASGTIWICISAPSSWQAVGGIPESVHWVGASGEPSFQNGWVNKTAPWQNIGYFLDPFGIVHLMGTCSTGTVSTTIFTLPTGYRPLARLNPSNVQINPDGTVVGPNSSSTCLDGITFRSGV